MPINPDILRQQPTFSDYMKLEDEFRMKKQAAEDDKLFKQAQIEALRNKGNEFDLKSMGEKVLFKAAMGIPLDEQDIATGKAYDAMRSKLFQDAGGNLISTPPAFGSMYGGQQQSRMQPQTQDAIPQMSQQGEYQPNIFAGVSPKNPPNLPNMGQMVSGGMQPKTRLEFEKENIKSDRAALDEIKKNALAAGDSKSSAQRMQVLQNQLGYTGIGSSVTSFLDKALTGLGAGNVIPGEPSAREEFEKESVTQWVNSVSPLKGALTEKEGARFDRAVANISMTPEGIKKMNELAIKLGKRAQEKSAFYENYYNQNGSLYGADKIWNDWSDANPVLPEVGGNNDSIKNLIDKYAD